MRDWVRHRKQQCRSIATLSFSLRTFGPCLPINQHRRASGSRIRRFQCARPGQSRCQTPDLDRSCSSPSHRQGLPVGQSTADAGGSRAVRMAKRIVAASAGLISTITYGIASTANRRSSRKQAGKSIRGYPSLRNERTVCADCHAEDGH